MRSFITSALLLLALLLPATAAADYVELDGIRYAIADNEASVSRCDRSRAGNVAIPSTVGYNGVAYPVTAIGSYAFNACQQLTEVTIPNSVISIGTYAFAGCQSLTSMTIPNSVTIIDTYAFDGCSGLTSVSIGNSVTTIGSSAFFHCEGLTSIVVASGNTTYDSRDDCNAIIETASNTLIAGCMRTAIPGTVTAIGDWAFGGCVGLTSVSIPNSVTSIGHYAFRECSGLMNVDLGNSVTTIGYAAFSACVGLTSVTIPNSVTTLSEEVFDGCTGLKGVTIGNSVTSIGQSLFRRCLSLSRLAVASGNPTYDSRGDCNAIIETASNTLIAGCSNTVIPGTVTAIGAGAFAQCGCPANVTIPNSVTSIGNAAFYHSNKLMSVTIGNSVTSIGRNAFYSCDGLTNVTIPNSVTTIGDGAFAHSVGLTSVTLSNSLTSIGYYVFAYCRGLTGVTIPTSVTSIGDEAFLYCKGLTSVNIPNSVVTIGRSAFYACTALADITIGNSVTSIGDWAFWGCSGLTDVYSHITDPSRVTYASSIFHLTDLNYSGRTLHVPQGTTMAYQTNENWYPYFGEIKDDVIPTFTGVGQYPVIEVIPEESTGLDKIFVVYNTDGVKMNYTASTDDAVTWERFDYSSGQLLIEELTDITHTGNLTTLNHVIPNTGYRITEGSKISYYWVVNYADHYMELNDVYINDDDPCNLLTINVDGHADAIYYYTVNGNRQVLDREIKLIYYTLVWNDYYGCWSEEETVENFASLDEGIEIVPPLCGTCFVLTGDRFIESWGHELALESEYYFTQAVDCRSTVTPKYNVDIMDGVLMGTAPLELLFAGKPTDAVGHSVWEMATDPDFEDIILQFNEDEIDYTFNEAGIYYMRYRVANKTRTCEACGEIYCIQVNSMACRPDVNRDGEVNIADVNFVVNVILEDYDLPEADVNGDREVNIADINAIINFILTQ